MSGAAALVSVYRQLLLKPKGRLAAAALLFLATVLFLAFEVYRPGLKGPFLLDADPNIPAANVASLAGAEIGEQFLAGERFLGASRGITRVSFALTHHFGDGTPFWFKYQNILLHLINGLLAFWLLLLLASERRLAPRGPPSASAAVWAAAAITTLWLLHPLHVSTVLYAVQRLVLLASLFMLAALICYVKGRALARSRPAAGASLALGGVGIFGLLGLLSKEIAALLPLLIALIEWFFFRLQFRSARDRRAIGIVLALIVVLPLMAGAIVVLQQFGHLWGWHPGRGFSGAERLMTEAHVLALYLKLFFVPVPGTMSLFHDGFPITHRLDAPTVVLFAIYVSLIVGALALRNRAPWIGFGILWFFICHLLESTVIPLELVFEHRNYLAILGLTASLVAAAVWLLSRLQLSRMAFPLLLSISLLLGFNTWVRSSDWGDLDRLLASEYARDPNSVRVLIELVNLASARGETRAALTYLDRLLALDIPEAGPELAALQVQCRSAGLSPALYQRALTKLESGRLSPFAVHGLGELANRTLRGGCPAISSGNLLRLVDAAIGNKHPRGLDQLCLAREIKLRLLIDAAAWPAAAESLSETLQRCRTAKPQTLQFIVENVVAFARCRGQLERTRALVAAALQDPGPREALDRAYAGRGGFDLDELVPAP